MAFRLPRLRKNDSVTEGDNPSPIYIRWWQSVVEKIETAIIDIEAALAALAGVEGGITGLQAHSDILDNLSDLTGTGLVEKTGAETFATRAMGVGAASAIPTRLDADNRYLRQDGTLSASAATTTHKIAVDIGGTTYYILLSNV